MSESSDDTSSHSSSTSNMDTSSYAEPHSVSSSTPIGTYLLLNGDSPTSTIRTEFISTLAGRYLISDLSLVRAARPGEKADSVIPGWISLYELPFESGFLLPLPKLFLDTCRHYNIAPAQLMPNAWRLILSLVRLSEKLKEPFTVDDLLHTYHTKSRGDEPGRYSLAVRPGRKKIVLNLAKSDKAWKDRFFFVKAEAVFEGYVGVPESWRSLVTSRVKLPKATPARKERAGRFLSRPKKERSWRYLLAPRSLRKSALWRIAAKKYQCDMELPSLDDVLKRHMSDIHQTKRRARVTSPSKEKERTCADELSSEAEPEPANLPLGVPDIADSAPEPLVRLSTFMAPHEGLPPLNLARAGGSSFGSIGSGGGATLNAVNEAGRIIAPRSETTSGPSRKRPCVTSAALPTTLANAEPTGGVSVGVPGASVPDIQFNFTFPGDTSLFSNSSPIIDEMSRFRFPEDDVYLGQMSDMELFDYGLLYSFGSMQVWYDFRRRYLKMKGEIDDIGRSRDEAIRLRDEARSELEHTKTEVERLCDIERQREELDGKFRDLMMEMNTVREVNKTLEDDKAKLVADLDVMRMANNNMTQSLDESKRRADGLSELVVRLEAEKATLEHRCQVIADFATVKTAAEIYQEVNHTGVDPIRMKAAEEAHAKLKQTLACFTAPEDVTASSDPIDEFLLTADHGDTLHTNHDVDNSA